MRKLYSLPIRNSLFFLVQARLQQERETLQASLTKAEAEAKAARGEYLGTRSFLCSQLCDCTLQASELTPLSFLNLHSIGK